MTWRSTGRAASLPRPWEGQAAKDRPICSWPPRRAFRAAAVTTVTVTASADPNRLPKGQTPPGESKLQALTAQRPQISPVFPLQLGSGHGALVEIFPDSTAETIWSSNNESIFGLAMRNDHVLFTTDSNGRIFDLDATPRRRETDDSHRNPRVARHPPAAWAVRTSTPPPAMWPNCSASGLPPPTRALSNRQ